MIKKLSCEFPKYFELRERLLFMYNHFLKKRIDRIYKKYLLSCCRIFTAVK